MMPKRMTCIPCSILSRRLRCVDEQEKQGLPVMTSHVERRSAVLAAICANPWKVV